MMAEMNIELLMTDIRDTVLAYEGVTGIVLQAEADSEGHIDTIGMFLTFDTVEQPSLYGQFEVFDLTLEGLQAIYDQVSVEFASLNVNLIFN